MGWRNFHTWNSAHSEILYCYKLSKCTKWHLFHSKGWKLSFRVKIVFILSVAQLVTTVIFFSAWDKSRVQHRKWGPKSIWTRDLCHCNLYSPQVLHTFFVSLRPIKNQMQMRITKIWPHMIFHWVQCVLNEWNYNDTPYFSFSKNLVLWK